MSATVADDLDCDFAEIYHICDRRSVPPKTAAVLAGGLLTSPVNGRIKRKITGQRFGADTQLLAAIADRLSTLVWFQTKDGQKNRNRPESILAKLIDEREHDDAQAFASAEEFEAERERRRAENR